MKTDQERIEGFHARMMARMAGKAEEAVKASAYRAPDHSPLGLMRRFTESEAIQILAGMDSQPAETLDTTLVRSINPFGWAELVPIRKAALAVLLDAMAPSIAWGRA